MVSGCREPDDDVWVSDDFNVQVVYDAIFGVIIGNSGELHSAQRCSTILMLGW